MARAHFVAKARKKNPVAKKGEPYWWWKFAYGAKRYSKTKPTRSQLTQSAFYSTLWTLEDETIAKASADDSLEGVRDEIVSELEALRDEQEEKRSNMPDTLQDSDTGNMLQERYDALDSAINDFQAIDFDDPEKEDGESDEDFEERTKAYWQEKLQELQDVSIDAP